MKENIFEFVNQYAVWGILILTFVGTFLLWRMQRQMKKLNGNLGMITKSVQGYFTVIMDENAKEDGRIENRQDRREDSFPDYEERERQMAEKKKQTSEEEAVFNSVFQEFFP